MAWAVWLLLCTAVLSNALWQEAAPVSTGGQRGGASHLGNPACACAGERHRTGGTGVQDGEASAAQRS